MSQKKLDDKKIRQLLKVLYEQINGRDIAEAAIA